MEKVMMWLEEIDTVSTTKHTVKTAQFFHRATSNSKIMVSLLKGEPRPFEHEP
jgi:hypothetical protein